MSISTAVPTWQTENQRYLVERLAVLRWRLEHHPRPNGPGANGSAPPEIAPWPLDEPPALDMLTTVFGLTPFEQEIVLLCAGVELDARIGPLCAAAQSDGFGQPWPTFGLALAALPDPHWSAMPPASPLRYWDLISLAPGQGLTVDRITISERILHYIAGVSYLDERLAGLVRPAPPAIDRPLAASSTPATTWNRLGSEPICLYGSDRESRGDAATVECAKRGMSLYLMPASAIPVDPQQRDVFTRLWDREAALLGAALLVECDAIDQSDLARWDAIGAFADRSRSTILLSHNDRRHPVLMRYAAIEIPLPSSQAQDALWQHAFPGERLSNTFTQQLTAQFSFSPYAIDRLASTAVDPRAPDAEIETSIWEACRMRSRNLMPHLAQRLDSNARWSDLVLPEPLIDILRDVATHVRQRTRVYQEWGFADRYARGLGISLLCAGPSGTGKTLAAEVLSNELQLDLYRIELSEIISKYIGETEKNLEQVFTAAEACGAMLLFDEADSIFGRRTEVRDSHDRYANIEVAYLLQRMESFQGLSILTTNMKDALDPAFMRRIRFVAQFPYPDHDDRERIWRQVLPARTPTAPLDYSRLARLNLSGGLIRNVAMNAAFLAAEDGAPVSMRHLAIAARREHAKQGKPLSEQEIGGWV